MTISCKPIGRLRFADLFDGQLQKFGVYERVIEGKSTHTRRSLTDGRNSIWVEANPDGDVLQLVHWGTNDETQIFEAIFAACGVKIFSEYEPEYWGFETRQAWNMARSVKEHEKFYGELVKYLQGQPNDLEHDETFRNEENYPTVIRLVKALIAKELVARDPSLATPERKYELLKALLTQFQDLRSAILWVAEDNGMFGYDDSRRIGRQCAEEDLEEGPLPAGGYIFQSDQHGVIVAVERPGSRRRGKIDDDVPF